MSSTSFPEPNLRAPTRIKSSHVSSKGINYILLGLLIVLLGFYVLIAFPLFLALGTISILSGTNCIAEHRAHLCTCPYCGRQRTVTGTIHEFQCVHCLEVSTCKNRRLIPK